MRRQVPENVCGRMHATKLRAPSGLFEDRPSTMDWSTCKCTVLVGLVTEMLATNKAIVSAKQVQEAVL